MAILSIESMRKEKEKAKMVSVWRNNKITNTLLIAIPQSYIEKYDIKPQDNLLVSDTENGILLRKVDLGGIFQ